ncbi:hypothetical protein L2A60_19330, partial [Acidiphilium iwatense]|nr:hypothetical protein [Acidiphilium iwatense]
MIIDETGIESIGQNRSDGFLADAGPVVEVNDHFTKQRRVAPPLHLNDWSRNSSAGGDRAARHHADQMRAIGRTRMDVAA